MNLRELKQRERELRHRLGDERYEQIYMRQQRAETITKPAAPAYKPEISTPAVSSRTESSFNTDRPDSGISNKPAIADFRKGIEELNKKIDSLNKQQYNTMLSGDDKKTAAYDGIIRNAEKQRDDLKIQMARAMGIGSESADKDMLRASFQKLDPLNSKRPGQVKAGQEGVSFSSEQNQIDRPKFMYPPESGGNTEKEPKPDPLTENNVYVSEEDYKSLNTQLDQTLDERYATDGPVVTPIDIDMKRTTLEQNRELSKRTEQAQSLYRSEEDAAVAFSETAVLETGNDWLERGAIIIGKEVPVVTADGQIKMEKRYELGGEFIGDHDKVVGGLLSAYGDAIDDMVIGGVSVSFVHTHPYCTGHEGNKFSGAEGDDFGNILNEFMDRVAGKKSFEDFAGYLGDKQVTWLPGVDRMYLASPTEKSLYACDENGPIMDPNDPKKYAVFGTFNAFAPNELQEASR